MLGLISIRVDLVQAQHKILFLRLRIQNDSITLVQSSVRPGTLKQTVGYAKIDGIEYRCQSADGLTLLSNVMSDPTVRRYEFEDPAQPGTLSVKQVKLKDVEFTLRIPFKDEMRRVEFFRVVSPGTSSLLQKSPRKFIGAIEIPSDGGGQ